MTDQKRSEGDFNISEIREQSFKYNLWDTTRPPFAARHSFFACHVYEQQWRQQISFTRTSIILCFGSGPLWH